MLELSSNSMVYHGVQHYLNTVPWFPHRLGNLEKWKNFSSQGKVMEFLTDSKSQGILPKLLEKLGNFSLIFILFFSPSF